MHLIRFWLGLPCRPTLCIDLKGPSSNRKGEGRRIVCDLLLKFKWVSASFDASGKMHLKWFCVCVNV